MTKWEYATITRANWLIGREELNLFGNDGWELVSFVEEKGDYGSIKYTAYLKRPKPEVERI